jgi:hypothetical protein
MSVLIAPGCTEVTPMLSFAISAHMASLSSFTDALVAQ